MNLFHFLLICSGKVVLSLCQRTDDRGHRKEAGRSLALQMVVGSFGSLLSRPQCSTVCKIVIEYK